MDNDKNVDFESGEEREEENGSPPQNAPRARNRTVMLTPEITGEVRARLQNELSEGLSKSSRGLPRPGFGEPPPAAPKKEEPPAFALPEPEPSRPSGKFSSGGNFGGGFGEAPADSGRPAPMGGRRPAATSNDGQDANIERRSFLNQNPADNAPPPQRPATMGFGSVQPMSSRPAPAEPPPAAERPMRGRDSAPAPSAPSRSAPVQPQAQAEGDHVIWAKKSKVLGFLVSYDQDENGQVFELRGGRLIVTSEPAASGNFLVLASETVSPMHAILRISEGDEIQILDQLSEHGTEIKRAGQKKSEKLSGDKGTADHGDIIKFGERSLHVVMVDFENED